MTQRKITKTPWKRIPGIQKIISEGTEIRASDAHGGSGVAWVLGGKSEECRANADLIASAPELLAALESLLDWARENTSPRDANSPHDLLVAASAAIAKAKGVTQ